MTALGDQPTAPPAGLRERVLAAALAARAAGRPTPDAPQISPVEGFGRAADALDGLLGSLGEDDWHRPVLRDLDVQGLVGHLIGVEEDLQRCLAGDPAVADANHVASTQPAARRQSGRATGQTRAEWRGAVNDTIRLVKDVNRLGEVVALHGNRLPLAAQLVVRAFELWTHDNDIRGVRGLPPSVPDASTLRLMTDLAAQLLPHIAQLTGLQESITMRLVLTGPGGGTWDLALGPDRPDPSGLRIVTDAVGFCRLAANRVTPDELDVHVTGDPGQAGVMLAAAAAMAWD